VVLSIDGEPVNSAPEMMFRLSARGIGGEARLDTLRGDTRSSATIALIAPPEEPARARLEVRAPALRGLVAENINPAVIAEFNLAPGASGVIVAGAEDIARRAGLRPGDILLAVNRMPVHSTADLERALRDAGRNWEVEIVRDGRRSWLRFRL